MKNRLLTSTVTITLAFAAAGVSAQDTCSNQSYIGEITPPHTRLGTEIVYENLAIDSTYGYISSSEFDQFLEQYFYALHVIDLADPQSPVLVAQADLEYPPSAIAVVDGIAYLTDIQGLRVIDMNDPHDPEQLALYPTPSFAMDLKIMGSSAYIARRNDGLEIVDISNPEFPIHIGEIDLPGEAHDLEVDNALVYFADEIGLRVIDASNPSSPALIGSVTTPAKSWDLCIDDDGIVYLADRFSGTSTQSSVRVYNMTNPASPNQIASVSYGPLGRVQHVHALGDQLFVVHGNDLQSLDITDPASPQPLGDYDQAEFVNEMIDLDGLLYTTSASDGLIIIDPSVDCAQCRADLNNDGMLDFFDISAFLSAFSAQDAQADFTDDGNLDFFDVSAFLSLFNAGCP